MSCQRAVRPLDDVAPAPCMQHSSCAAPQHRPGCLQTRCDGVTSKAELREVEPASTTQLQAVSSDSHVAAGREGCNSSAAPADTCWPAARRTTGCPSTASSTGPTPRPARTTFTPTTRSSRCTRRTCRVNTINGRKYSEDPTIYYWNLLNEPRWCAPVPHPISTLQYREPLRAGSGVLAVPGNNALPQSGMRSHRAAWACGRTLGRGCPLHMLFALRLEALQSKSACCLSVWNLAPAVVVVIC